MHDYTIPLFMTYLEGLTLQYIAVAIIVLIALIILIRKILRISRHRTGNSICSGCPDIPDRDSGSCPD